MPQLQAGCQGRLFEEAPDAPAARLPPEVQERLRQALVQWMQTLAKTVL